MFDPQTLGELCEMYAIGQPISYSSHLRDESAIQFNLITSKGSYSLICPPEGHSLRALNCEHGLIRYLERQGYPAPTVLLTRYGTTTALIKRRLYVLMSAHPDLPYDSARPAHLRAAARALGSFHYLAQAYTGQPPETDVNGLEGPDDKAESTLSAVAAVIGHYCADDHIASVHALLASLRAELQPLGQMVDRVDSHLLLCTIIHGAYRPAVLRYQSDTLTTVLDYAHAHWAPRLTDLAQALISFCGDPRPDGGGALDLDHVHLFMEAYRERCTMRYEEASLLPLSMRVSYINTALDVSAAFLTSRRDKRQVASANDLLHTLSDVVERLAWLDTHSDALVHATTSHKSVALQ